MNAFIITLCLIGMTCAYNPALVTSNTYPARTNTYNPNNPYNTQQQQYYDPSSSSQYSSTGYNSQYQTQGQDQYRRPTYNQGMISPVNYTPNYQNRAVQIPPFARRNAMPQAQGDQMQIMPYPYQYTPQYRSQQQSASGNSQTQQ